MQRTLKLPKRVGVEVVAVLCEHLSDGLVAEGFLSGLVHSRFRIVPGGGSDARLLCSILLPTTTNTTTTNEDEEGALKLSKFQDSQN